MCSFFCFCFPRSSWWSDYLDSTSNQNGKLFRKSEKLSIDDIRTHDEYYEFVVLSILYCGCFLDHMLLVVIHCFYNQSRYPFLIRYLFVLFRYVFLIVRKSMHVNEFNRALYVL